MLNQIIIVCVLLYNLNYVFGVNQLTFNRKD
ncbi:unnamed protein product [Schistosoma curassoni]|uniref:Uncharacterized protein n=1 Tax=Schistosoma curassoni TaxID=6186 RepID=A0A183JUQ9_9TREM|nr:unnamed protein product [Schistosoma curassoni]